MTPTARIASAATILDDVLSGEAAEKALLGWARQSRFAGSKDRAAIRDLVFDGLRRQRSLAWLGGAVTGRGLMLGLVRDAETDPASVFTGEGYGPAALTETESRAPPPLLSAPAAVRVDCPDWLYPLVHSSLGPDADAVLDILRQRAPVILRVNTTKDTAEAVVSALAKDGIAAHRGPLSKTALEVDGHPRRIRNSKAFQSGMVELQDAASQAVVDLIMPHAIGKPVLDYCAGGGGKALHLAAAGAGTVIAHDAEPARMRDIPDRAARGGHSITITEAPQGSFACVLTDVPCSGSGAWRRQPEAKWRLTPDRLAVLNTMQDAILDSASVFVRPGGVLAYVTCSLLEAENADRVAAFLARQDGWRLAETRQFTPLDGGDGFFVAILRRA